MKYDSFQYQDLLKLDSFYRILTFKERITLHALILKKPNAPKLNARCQAFVGWINDTNWEAPEIRFGQDRLLYYKSEETNIPIEEYAEKHPETTKQVKAINNQHKYR